MKGIIRYVMLRETRCVKCIPDALMRGPTKYLPIYYEYVPVILENKSTLNKFGIHVDEKRDSFGNTEVELNWTTASLNYAEMEEYLVKDLVSSAQ